nr:MAG TPA: hypothetical protein [Caudoviricetes sp.]
MHFRMKGGVYSINFRISKRLCLKVCSVNT